MDLSIIIPAYEEQNKITRDIREAAAFLHTNKLTGEIIVVDDGSEDQTADAARSVEPELPNGCSLEVIRNDHRGKGYAVRTGILRSKGEYVMFADSGSCTPYENALRGLKLMRQGHCDIALGSRKLSDSHIRIPQSLYRRFCSRMFHWFMIIFMRIPGVYTDTQCGFKMYRGSVARSLYEQCVTEGFMFDVEILLRAKKRGITIREFPIEWTCDRDSRVAPMHNSLAILVELRRIKKILKNQSVTEQIA